MSDNPLFDAACDVAVEIGDERARQIMQEGYLPERDDGYTGNELALAAAAYLVNGTSQDFRKSVTYDNQAGGFRTKAVPRAWPHSWNPVHFKPGEGPKGRRRDLVKAAALIVAEIERLDRAAVKGRS